MPERSLPERVEMLEQKVDVLETLPARMTAMEAQLVQLRADMGAEFSATREELRAEVRAGDEQTRDELRAEIRAGDEQTRTELRAEIRAEIEQTRNYMRVLHEDVISRIATIQDALPRRRKQ